MTMKQETHEENVTYLLRCADGSLYCGWTNDPEKRLAAHNAGTASKYTRSRRPVELVYTESFATRREAMSREAIIKRMTRAEKEKLLKGEDGYADSGRVYGSASAHDRSPGGKGQRKTD